MGADGGVAETLLTTDDARHLSGSRGPLRRRSRRESIAERQGSGQRFREMAERRGEEEAEGEAADAAGDDGQVDAELAALMPPRAKADDQQL